MLVNVLLRTLRSLAFCVGLAVIMGFAGLTAAASGKGIADLSTTDYLEVFCGTPIYTARKAVAPVVRPQHNGPVTVTVSIFQFEYLPTNLTINVGDTVRWSNDDALPHTATSNTGVWNSGSLNPGASYSFTFNNPGDFPYHCNLHFFMAASITVLGPSPTPTYTPTDTPTNTATATATDTPTNTATPTPSVPPSISGTITYGNASGAPNPRFVSNVLLSAVGSPNVFGTTDFPGGNYSITGFGAGSYTVTPTKTDGVNSITSFDAAKIAQHVSGSSILTGNALIVADTSNNGSVTSFDAARIAQYVSGGTIVQPNVTGTWRFLPVNRTYPSINVAVNGEDYIALLMGEVSGNWANVTPTSTPTATPTPQLVILYDMLGGPGNWGWFNSALVFGSNYDELEELDAFSTVTHLNTNIGSGFVIRRIEFAPDYYNDNTGQQLPLTDGNLNNCKIKIWDTNVFDFSSNAAVGSYANISPGPFTAGSRTVPVGTQSNGWPVYVIGWDNLNISLPAGMAIQISIQCPTNRTAAHFFDTIKSVFTSTDTAFGATKTFGGSQQNFTYLNTALDVKIVGHNWLSSAGAKPAFPTCSKVA